MLNSLRSATARAQHPSLFSYSLSNHIVNRKPSGIRFAQAASGPNQPDSSDNMDSKQDPESKTGDTMSSLGEGYATRCDEEGFGGIYGQNQYVSHDDEDEKKNAPGVDHNQGSEVKEKEKARNQSKVAS
ncbi:hypothetical protein CDL12_03126 [Handroanthus impetiginosus]|uniref:Uncharacterized protein n=1 Tax=Handroanthus impetiginosus TaxID=429701 RepID=A0A2G9GP91_9LAMI|nr:hypothetical protein CDL12_20355 [Handroanthus impetiginosus]PIN24133.1 hypothetical protein CDL12_03126 [Handroanthus impetiginosus]